MIRTFLFLPLICAILAVPVLAQNAPADEAAPVGDVSVEPTARDDQIQTRISNILAASGWFSDATVSVEDGIVFLDGETDTEAHRTWARDLAARTQDVVAVVNRLEVEPVTSWTFAPAFDAMRDVAKRIVTSLPLIVLALVILPLTWWLSSLAAAGLRRWLLSGVDSPFLKTVMSRLIALPIFLLGIYVVLQVAGLTQLALSVVGGAGVIGIVVGFAFRDIAENFLASLLLSVRQPFRQNDFIVVEGMEGTVHSLNTRSTVLISRDGNQIQIPNATVFKSVITNFTATPETRDNISVGIGYDAPVNTAQDIIATVLKGHDGILDEPQPMILVEELGSSTVNLVAYYWFDIRKLSRLKVKSSVLRLVKKALTEAGISMPDDAREIIFPEGVPLVPDDDASSPKVISPPPVETDAESTEAEGALQNEQEEVVERAARADLADDEDNLIR